MGNFLCRGSAIITKHLVGNKLSKIKMKKKVQRAYPFVVQHFHHKLNESGDAEELVEV